ncbi:hypothetical protein ACWCRJ_10550, partial [Streptomyces sp. NPDC002324]
MADECAHHGEDDEEPSAPTDNPPDRDQAYRVIAQLRGLVPGPSVSLASPVPLAEAVPLTSRVPLAEAVPLTSRVPLAEAVPLTSRVPLAEAVPLT